MRPLQQAVLRPLGRLPGDRPPPAGWTHLAALRDGAVVGAASFGPAAWPRPELAVVPDPAWQLRSMAVRADARNQGVGAALLEAVVREALDHGVAALWAEARVAALPLYVRAGWTVVGPRWDKAGVGPHHHVTLVPSR